jgi:hypothetical protein
LKLQWKTGFGLIRFRSPLLAESRLFSLPPGTEMVHFPGLARTCLCIQQAVTGFCPAGFPHSEILGSKGVSPSPRLIAGNRVLHRRLAPRHPPYALSSLTITSAQYIKTASNIRLTASKSDFCESYLSAACRLLSTASWQIRLHFTARIQPGQLWFASPLIPRLVFPQSRIRACR